MNARWFYLAEIFGLLFLCFLREGDAAQPYGGSRPYSATPQGQDPTFMMRQLKTNLTDIKHEIHNHELEIRTFEERLHNQEISMEHLRQQLSDSLQSQQDFAKASTVNLEGKIETIDQSLKNLEPVVRGLIGDLHQLKTQANDSVAALGQYKQKMGDLEKLLEAQSLHMQNLEAALHSMMEVIQSKEEAVVKEILKGSGGQKTYKVQAGDTLEKIARSQKVSVKALREANQLADNNDHIFVNQTLKIP